MKKIFIISSSFLLLLASCKKDLQNLNEEVKRPTNVPAPSLFASAQKELVDAMTSANVNLNVFRLVSQYWTETTYTDETNYNFTSRNIPQNFWNALYRDVLNNFYRADSLIDQQDSQTTSAAVKKNQHAVNNIMEVYAFSILVNTFGNIPYTQALNINTISPSYDDAKTVYYDLLMRLDTALSALDAGSGSFGTSDLLYNGDVSKWLLFGNSLKLKLGMIIADVDPGKAKSVVESAALAGVLSSNLDNAVLKYKEAPPNTNPIWVDLVQSGRRDFVATHVIVDTMNALADPRRPFYFTLDRNDAYSGGSVGSGNTYSLFSTASDKITQPNFEALLLDYAEVQFLLAEAAARGFGVGGTAAAFYNNAVTASIEYWGGTQEDATTYLANPNVNYLTAQGGYKAKIGTQQWLALYNRGFDAWIALRRLDYPVLNLPTRARSGFPVRFTYPVQEQNLNTQNYNAASAAIGGDKVETKLFWDVN